MQAAARTSTWNQQWNQQHSSSTNTLMAPCSSHVYESGRKGCKNSSPSASCCFDNVLIKSMDSTKCWRLELRRDVVQLLLQLQLLLAEHLGGSTAMRSNENSSALHHGAGGTGTAHAMKQDSGTVPHGSLNKSFFIRQTHLHQHFIR